MIGSEYGVARDYERVIGDGKSWACAWCERTIREGDLCVLCEEEKAKEEAANAEPA
jgi:hypothetical protein